MKYEAKIEEDENGELFVKLPDELMAKMGWNEYTILSTELEGSKIIVKQKTTWTVEEAQENIELMIEDVQHNKTIHHIFDGDKEVVMVPYEEEIPPKWKDVIRD